MRLKSKEFDHLRSKPAQTRIGLERATKRDLETIYPILDVALAHQLAALSVLERIRKHHPDNLWAIRNLRTDKTAGIYGLLLLNAAGHAAVLDGSFTPTDPDPATLATPDQQVAAIYKWGVYAPGVLAAAFSIMSEKLSHPEFRHLDIFGNGTTEAGRRMLRTLGFRRVEGGTPPNLFVYHRHPDTGATYPPPQ